jgi:hypothetical protein
VIGRVGWDGAVVVAAGLLLLVAVAVRGPAGVGHWVAFALAVDAVYLALRWSGRCASRMPRSPPDPM